MSPLRATLCTTGLLLAVLSCGGKEEGAGKTAPERPETSVPGTLASDAAASVDAAVVLDVAVQDAASSYDAGAVEDKGATANKKAKKHTVAELAGLWTGSAVVPSYGTVLANVRLNKKGKGSYSAKISGFTKTGSVQVLSWNGKRIRARGNGMVRSVPAKLSGNKLTLRLPIVGKVIVYRGK